MIELSGGQWVGLALALWLQWDFYTGKTWIHRAVYRRKETALYWLVMLGWAVISALLLSGFWQ